jgi:hypothetical protein
MDEVIAHAEGVSIGERPEISFEWFGAAFLAITRST